ncbi:unnamed protein product [Phytophthora lilii]|uniref:Unnamed protein product n=1 Tax=Phytophthora lilii TaxID=2077276 RepID=A0A9W6UE23_9STRA|nr:unnamed protein product [Phytophthora lilii]
MESLASDLHEVVSTGWTRPLKKNKDGKPRKPRKGWGPFRSVLNERSVDFNLTLDVQNLKQDVVQEVKRKRVLNEQDQQSFLNMVMDAKVDVGNDLYGTEVMIQQMKMYSTFLRTIRLTMQSFDVVTAEDSVVISTKATLRFQVLRSTIAGIFPHIMGNEWLVSQLVGKEVEPAMGITFFFNSEAKCCKYMVDLDFVGAFMSIVKNPDVVNMLPNRALIADNCMFGVIDEPLESEEEGMPTMLNAEQVIAQNTGNNDLLEAERDRPVAWHKSLVSSSSRSEIHSWGISTDVQKNCLRAVDDYFRVFANGYQSNIHGALFRRHFESNTKADSIVSPQKEGERWDLLSKYFSEIRFQQKAVLRSNMDPTWKLALSKPVRNTCCAVLAVPSQIKFFMDSETGRILGIEERMDFAIAIVKLVNTQDLRLVMANAHSTLEN